MNAPDLQAREKFAELLSLTREPFPASTKVYETGALHPDLRVPMRRIDLSNGEQVTVYDTSGPYTEPTAAIDVRRGLPSVRGDWIARRGDTETYEGRAEPLIWEGIVLGSLAEQKGGLGALPLLKQARSRFEQALHINDQALEGSAYTGLGVLYYKAPGWPLSFGDKAQARALLTKALSLQPRGLDANYFYAEYLVESRQQAQALPYLQKALTAPDDPGRPLTNAARRQEARALLDRIRQAR